MRDNFHISNKITKYLGILLIRGMHDLYKNNYYVLVEDSRGNLNGDTRLNPDWGLLRF